MGNRAIITFENENAIIHPIAVYVHWNGGLESVLAFVKYTWETFPRGRTDLYTFHARFCQVVGNFFQHGRSLYCYPTQDVSKIKDECDNGHFHFSITKEKYDVLNRTKESVEITQQHEYWTDEYSIFDGIQKNMPLTKDQAHLLNAAPELLELCLNVETDMQTLLSDPSIAHEWSDPENGGIELTISALQKAIAKAEGK